MNKKLTVVGKGTVGALSVAHFLKYTNWDIEWIFDEDIPAVSVGEATNLLVPQELSVSLQFQHSDLLDVNGTVKQGVYKKYWSSKGEFLHPFPVHMAGFHFNANELHTKLLTKLQNNNRVTITKGHVSDPEALESDFVLVCSGSPKSLSSESFVILDNIPVNSVYVVQCDWDYPHFTYSLTNAMKYGWVFGIPLQNRISIGYLYNSDINSIEDIKKDIQNVFDEYHLTPSEKTQNFSFNSFYRKNNFSSKVIYNGNASFFLEPLEATSTGLSTYIYRMAWELWNGHRTVEESQWEYEMMIKDIESMILLHYMAGSIYNTDFWSMAVTTSTEHIIEQFVNQDEWSHFVYQSVIDKNIDPSLHKGSWGSLNYAINIEKLGLKEKILELYNQFK